MHVVDSAENYLGYYFRYIRISNNHPFDVVSMNYENCVYIHSYEAWTYFKVYWGDGNIDYNYNHCYTESGYHNVKIPWHTACFDTVRQEACINDNNNSKSAPVTRDISGPKPEIWPNPATNSTNIRVFAISTVRIKDMNGKAVFEKFVNPGTTELPLNLNPGVYIVEIIEENASLYSLKLVIK